MSSEPVSFPRAFRRIAALLALAGAVAACGKDPAPSAGSAGDAAGAAAMACPSSDPVAFVAAFAEDPALQRAFTAPTVEVAGDSGSTPTPRDQLAFPVMPDRAAQQREGLRQGGFERADDRVTVTLDAPGRGAQSRYVFRRDAACWVLQEIAGRAVAQAPSTPAADPRAIARGVMASRYGDHYDAERDCWPTTRQVNGGSIAYCLRPGTPSIVETGAGRQLLFLAGSVQDVDHSPRKYAYASTDPGLVGLFVVALRGGGWSLVAAADGETIGSNGDCACVTARLQRMGRDVYGWTMVDGGIWQGVETSSHVVFAPVGARVARVATVPDVATQAQGVHHDIGFDPVDPAAERYPLTVTTRGGSGDGGRSTIAFDPAGGRYPVPAGP